MGSGCPFCCLTDRELVWESALVVAFRDGYPVSRGHTLVVPRRHVETYFEAGPLEQAEIWRAVGLIKEALDRDFHPDGYNVGFNAGSAAGQTVPHLHIHVIPRYRGDMDDPRGGIRGAVPHMQKYGSAATSVVERVLGGETDKPGSATATPFDDLPEFVAGDEQHFVHALRQALRVAERADFLAAFVQKSGVQLLLPDIEDALHRGTQIRVLTGDYLGITGPDALRVLLRLQSEHATFRAALYRTTGDQGFHPKSYLFFHGCAGVAYVGSSNLSARALQGGIEWNLRLVSPADSTTVQTMARRFDGLWCKPATALLSADVIARYESETPERVLPGPEPREPPPVPHVVQQRALEELQKTRAEGHRAGLVVLATGLGKTYLAAFDLRALGGERALYVAHREEILGQARDAWSRVFPEKTTGILGMGRAEADADLVFASVQTIARKSNLERFARDRFSYIVIDEFHHAAAATYRKVISYFEPKFLLGLTATPDRLDGAQLLDLCEENEVYRHSIVQGIGDKLLVPFRYFGVRDEIDFAPIPWRANNFDIEALTKAAATRGRADQALREYRKHASADSRRTLAFCCSTKHADFMADYFRSQGLKAVAVHSEPSSAPRADSLRRLKDGSIEIICAVDVFNEGLDIPQIDTVLMLRPTLSPVVFLQQLGRGLRRAEGKADLCVVDFIGNHRSFLRKLQGLVFLTGAVLPPLAALERLRVHGLDRPEFTIDVSTEAIEMLEKLARASPEDGLIYEYLLFRDTHDRRPRAAELAAAGVRLKAVVDRYADWFDFVRRQGDLTDDEQRLLSRHGTWFRDLLTTPMSKAYKMIALRVLLDGNSLFGGTNVAANAEASLAFARRHPLLKREMSEDAGRREMSEEFIRKWREMPLGIWAKADGTAEKWFALDGDRFATRLQVETEDRPVFEAMTDELVEFRLWEHVDGLRRKTAGGADDAPAVLAVSHSSGRPILRFDRTAYRDLPPEGLATVEVDGEPYSFRFVKIAVNVATKLGEQTNVLPSLMRRWFGPNAGLPGSRHRVLLRRSGSNWLLSRADDTALPALDAEVIPFPRLPFFSDLKVACGALGAADPISFAERSVAVSTGVEMNPKRHFVVQASGDSMDGGDNPIRDQDLVLCEWWQGGDQAEVIGKPYLLVGHGSPETSFQTIKVPILQGDAWKLRSWNTSYPDQELPPGTRLEPVAKVVGVVEETTGLQLWGQYDRNRIAAAFGTKADRSWQVGHRDTIVLSRPHTVLMVTLRKPDDTPTEHRYADRFRSKDELQWESQASTKPDWAKGRRLQGHEAEGRTIHLFVRREKVDDFTYCGPVRYGRHEGEAPMRIWFRLDHPLPEQLWLRWGE